MNTRMITLSAALVLLFADSLRADLYVAEDVTGFDSDWSFDGGTFTIQNGFSGGVDDGNVETVFESWSISFTSPDGSHNLTPVNSTVGYMQRDSPDLVIMSGEISFPTSTGTESDVIMFSGGGLEIKWTSSTGALAPLLQLSAGALGSATRPYGTQGGVGLIATAVPEPTSALYVTAAGLGLMGIRIVRRRRAI